MYYRLECIDCRERFGLQDTPRYVYPAIVTTPPDSLLRPDFDKLNESFGARIVSEFKEWRRLHQRHRLEEVPV